MSDRGGNRPRFLRPGQGDPRRGAGPDFPGCLPHQRLRFGPGSEARLARTLRTGFQPLRLHGRRCPLYYRQLLTAQKRQAERRGRTIHPAARRGERLLQVRSRRTRYDRQRGPSPFHPHGLFRLADPGHPDQGHRTASGSDSRHTSRRIPCVVRLPDRLAR